jgi:hypothetical protein
MNTVLNPGLNPMLEAGPPELTMSMAAVDAAAARAALADHLQLTPVDLEHPAVVAVLAAVVSAGWRPPAPRENGGVVADPAPEPAAPALFGPGCGDADRPADPTDQPNRVDRWEFPW